MMPVVPDVPALAVPELVAARQAAVRRGREGRLAARDLASGAAGAWTASCRSARPARGRR
jgi:hypothetical protein